MKLKEAMSTLINSSYHCGCCSTNDEADDAEVTVARLLVAESLGYDLKEFYDDAKGTIKSKIEEVEELIEYHKREIEAGEKYHEDSLEAKEHVLSRLKSLALVLCEVFDRTKLGSE